VRVRCFQLAAALAVVIGTFTSCGPPQSAPPSAAERALAAQVGLSDSALAIIRATASGPLGELHPLDSNGSELPARGVSFALPQRRVPGTIARLHERLGAGYLVFQADRGYGITPDSIGIIASTDPFDILRVRSTDGINYDITNDSVLALARVWNDQFGLEFTGAAQDWFEARLMRPPADYLAFANALYAICPDIVDQGTNTVAALADEMRRTNVLFCWWD
jgi:hypothetical protein